MQAVPPAPPRRRIRSSLLSNLLLAILLAALLVLLRILGPQESLRASRLAPPPEAGPAAAGPGPAAAPSASASVQLARSSAESATVAAARTPRFVRAGDTINGEPLRDAILVGRIERIAAGLPAELLAGTTPAPHVRYLAQAFGAGDDPPIYYGLFREPAAALAFGCALDEALGGRCQPVRLAAASSVFDPALEDPPGVQCRPMRLALGAAAYEPDRCEAVD